jgi:hypothetical protein
MRTSGRADGAAEGRGRDGNAANGRTGVTIKTLFPAAQGTSGMT